MGQTTPFRSAALIVEDDPLQREMVSLLLEETNFDVIQCESAEAAERVLEKTGPLLSLLITDVQLAGRMDGLELAQQARERVPDLKIIITSGRPLVRRLPDGVTFWAKPWAPLDLLREAERVATQKGAYG
jgi:two-component system, cell cycle response regulator CpdR